MWVKVLGLGRPEIFAEGAANDTPAASITARAAGCEGQRTATVSRPPLVSYGTISDFGSIIVRGPGQNLSASRSALSGRALTSGAHCSTSVMCTISGLSPGLPLASNIFFTATGSRALAARPYTVSVGMATRPPVRSISPARAMPSGPPRSISVVMTRSPAAFRRGRRR